jgi:hypothetical protein
MCEHKLPQLMYPSALLTLPPPVEITDNWYRGVSMAVTLRALLMAT